MYKFKYIIFLLTFGCDQSDDDSALLKGPWEEHGLSSIELFVRPEGFSNKKSPSMDHIDLILKNQNNFIQTISQKFKVKSNASFKIFLFNQDEASQKIGIKNGGGANLNRGEIYFSYNQEPQFNNNIGIYTFLGLHELTHLILFEVFQCSTTRLMTEGYATSADNAYGAYYNNDGLLVKKSNREWMIEHFESQALLSPSELIIREDLPENIFYPQAATFVDWMLDTYGVDVMNNAYCLNGETLQNYFETALKMPFEVLENEYLDYCEQEFNLDL